MRKIAAALLHIVWLAALLCGFPVEAGPVNIFTVVSALDEPDDSPGNNACADLHVNCTLRAAVMEANAHVGPDTIILPADTFQLDISGSGEDAAATGDLDLKGSVTLQGAGAASSIIDATGLDDRVLDVRPGAAASLSGITIRGGTVPAIGTTYGGGLFNAGAVTLTQVTITQNNLFPVAGTVFGGGLGNLGTGVVVLDASRVFSNGATNGGGIVNEGKMTITGSSIFSNTALVGGGLYNSR